MWQGVASQLEVSLSLADACTCELIWQSTPGARNPCAHHSASTLARRRLRKHHRSLLKRRFDPMHVVREGC
jgi:hypothetical protein